MCYSSSSTSTNLDLAKKYRKETPLFPEPEPAYLISAFRFPTLRIITLDPTIQLADWGLIPFWHDGANLDVFRTKTLNARIETISEKPSYRDSYVKRRCIVPSNGFYEWQTNGKAKDPFFIYLPEKEILSIAGIFDFWKSPHTGEEFRSFTLVTCPANPLMSEIHNTKMRMPVLLNDAQVEGWLHNEIDAVDLFNPSKNDELLAHPIDKRRIQAKENSAAIQQPFLLPFGKQTNLFD